MLKTYLEFQGLDAMTINALEHEAESSDTFNRIRYIQIQATYALIIGHEIGHHLLGHVEREIGQKEEAEADKFGATLAIKAGYFPIFALAPYMLFDRVEARSDLPSDERSHPPAACRAVRATLASLTALKNDPDFQSYL